jgi:HEAT repeat protein
MTLKSSSVTLTSCVAALSLLLVVGPTRVAAAAVETHNCSPQQVRELITLLKSEAPKADKAIACKKLAVFGDKDAVPALEPLLTDPELTSWARIALEVIPGPASDAALRHALYKVQGRVLVGVINSIAVRRDPKAVGDLIRHLKSPDSEVASAAAVALGRIGGMKAADALSEALITSPEAVRNAVAQGCILCAERLIAEGKRAEAIKVYDDVRVANVPWNRQLEAIRGAILARQSAGLPLLLTQLRWPDQTMFGIGLSTARELPGRDVTEALAAELQRCSPDRQAYLLLAIADRTDAAVMPTVLQAATSGSLKVRLTAVGILDRMGSVASLPVLLNVAADQEAELAQAALGALARLPGNEVDTELVSRLSSATGKNRQVLILLAGQRHTERALSAVVSSTSDSDAGVRTAAVQTIGILGTDAQAADLVKLLQGTKDAKERGDIEMALLAISGRTGAKSVPALLPLARSDDSALRIIALHVLASDGGPEALAAVQAAVQDKDEAVQDEAVRTLSTWPNNWPEDNAIAEPLLTLAKSAAKNTHQVLGLRGYLQYLQANKQLKADDKLAKLNDVQPLIKRPEEKRLFIAAIGTAPNSKALEMLVTYVGEADFTEDACSAIVKLAEVAASDVPQEQRQKALLLALEKSDSDATRKQARKLAKPAQ